MNTIENVKDLGNEIKKVIKWQDRFLPQIKDILKVFNYTDFRIATMDEDCKEGFDVCFTTNDFNVKENKCGVRIRNYKFRNYNDVTIRYKTQRGYETEYEKLKSGKAFYYLYGYMNEEQTELCKYVIIDFKKLKINNAVHKMNTQVENKDHSQMCYYDLRLLYYYGCIIHSYGYEKYELKGYTDMY